MQRDPGGATSKHTVKNDTILDHCKRFGVHDPDGQLCVRLIPIRIRLDAKNDRFFNGNESCYELDFARKQTAKNGGFVYREFLNLHRVILNFWIVQRVKHMRIVSNSWQLRKMVRRTGIMQVIKPKTRGWNSGLVVTKLLAGGSLSFVCLNL